MMSGAALAQDPPPPAEPEKAAPQEPAQTPSEEKKEEQEAKPERLRPVTLGLGWSDWNLSGNARRFRQYATPPESLFTPGLRYDRLGLRSGHQAFLALKGLGEEDYRSEGQIDLWHGRLRLEGFLARSRFFEPTPVVIGQSEDRDTDGSLKLFLSRTFSISARYTLLEETNPRDVPLEPFVQKTRSTDLVAAGRLGNGQVRLSLSDWRYFDRTLVLRDTRVERWQLRYLWEPTPTVGIEGAYAHMNITQPAAPSGRAEVLSLAGDVAAGPSTNLDLGYRRDKIGLPVVANAYSREQRLFRARMSHRWRRWSAQFGVQYRELERLRGNQLFVDVPAYVTFDGRLSGRISPQWRLTLRGWAQDLSDEPPMTTSDTRSLLWSGRQLFQVRLEGGPPDLGSYLSFTHRNWDNGARGSSLSLNQFQIGGTWTASPVLEVFAEYSHEAWSAKTDVAAAPVIGLFAPNAHVIAAGANWSVGPRSFVGLSYSTFWTENDNPLQLRDGNTRGHFLTIQARHLFPSGHEVGLLIAPWTYTDKVVGAMDYDAAIVMVTGSARF